MLLSEHIRERLEELRVSHVPVIVEGIKDKKALASYGITSVIVLNKPLFCIVEELNTSVVVILTDCDHAGKQLYHQLFVLCQRHGIHVDNTLRHLLFSSQVSHIEGLFTFLNHLRLQE